MGTPDPTDSSPDPRERHAVAELLGRVLAAYWLANRRPANEWPIRPASVETPLTASTVETYDGR